VTGGGPPTFRIRPAGDSALLLELDAVVDPRVNARAIAIASAVREAAVPGVRDVVSTYRSVAVYFDPRRTNRGELRHAMMRASDAPGEVPHREPIELAVSYGRDDGPDLNEVAAWAGLAVQDVVARHTATIYRVFMLGFLPGFAYMGNVDAAIAAPRRATPRLSVPAGSIGLAGVQTGIYPMASPGGWRIIGRTREVMFDPLRTPAARLSPGDRVRFTAVTPRRSGGESQSHTVPPITHDPGSRCVTVLKPGLFTTVQDGGRWGHQATGVPVAGAMDSPSYRLANRLVGNDEDAASLEATITGPELRFNAPVRVAVAGADLAASLDDRNLPPGTVADASSGSVLRFGDRQSGTRAYIACGGGIITPPVLGSRATHTLGRMGGLEGRALRAGDRLDLGPNTATPGGSRSVPRRSECLPRGGGVRVRALPGPQAERFPPDALDILQRTRFTVSPQSNRMGYRLTGGVIGPPAGDMISDATFTGALQVPPSGEPILLMADRQTTGGYAQLAIVITADLPLAGQLAPGEWIEFALCSHEEALDALADREAQVGDGG
jgi:KipI family sensor histidine kinase inhibitor